MEKEEAMKILKDFHDKSALFSVRTALDTIIPELKESEDEKAKRIIDSLTYKISQHLRDIFTEEEYQCFDAWSNAWLKKHGNKIWTDNDYDKVKSIEYLYKNLIIIILMIGLIHLKKE